MHTAVPISTHAVAVHSYAHEFGLTGFPGNAMDGRKRGNNRQDVIVSVSYSVITQHCHVHTVPLMSGISVHEMTDQPHARWSGIPAWAT